MNRRVATVFIDALFLLLLVLVILPHQPEISRDTPSVDLFSEIIIGARWEDGSNVDVDLWVRAPGGKPVGYSKTRGHLASLAWDDVGNVDSPPWRYEAALIRSAPDGEYIVNLHFYRAYSYDVRMPVTVAVWRKLPEGEMEIWSGKVVLTSVGQEITVVRFRLSNKQLVPGSIHDRYQCLRSC